MIILEAHKKQAIHTAVFDFDGTIYDGDSSIDFWIFCLKCDFSLTRFLPNQLLGIVLYKLRIENKEKFKSRYFSFFKGIKNIKQVVADFWNKNETKIKDWYKKIQKEDDCVISASPEVLLAEVCNRLNIKNLIATKVDKKTGKLIGKNCHDKNKPEFFRQRFGNIEIEKFYSDSKSDLPMAKMAKEAFLVNGNIVKSWI